LELVTKTKSTVSVPQAVTSEATRRLAAETSRSWPDLLNFMRIFRQRAEIACPKKLGLESNSGGVNKSGAPAFGYVL
jgi:hypothetical protein